MAKQGSQVEERARKKTVVVAGDLVVDHCICKGGHDKPSTPAKRG